MTDIHDTRELWRAKIIRQKTDIHSPEKVSLKDELLSLTSVLTTSAIREYSKEDVNEYTAWLLAGAQEILQTVDRIDPGLADLLRHHGNICLVDIGITDQVAVALPLVVLP